MRHLPRSEEIQAGEPVSIFIDTEALVIAERAKYESSLNDNDLGELIRNYPVRETGALNSIAKALGFQSRSQYESAVRKLLIDDADALAFVRNLFGDLPNAVAGT